jgi:hypothetical protein
LGWPLAWHGSGFVLDPYAFSINCTVAVINNRFEVTKGMALRSPD